MITKLATAIKSKPLATCEPFDANCQALGGCDQWCDDYHPSRSHS